MNFRSSTDKMKNDAWWTEYVARIAVKQGFGISPSEVKLMVTAMQIGYGEAMSDLAFDMKDEFYVEPAGVPAGGKPHAD